MAKKSKQARAREFNEKARQEIYYRDRAKCIFCTMGYRMEQGTWLGKEILGVMHYIPRSRNGLGIPKNGALGCQYHHEIMDNGNQGVREEMLGMFREYLKNHYEDWNEEELVYRKWNF